MILTTSFCVELDEANCSKMPTKIAATNEGITISINSRLIHIPRHTKLTPVDATTHARVHAGGERSPCIRGNQYREWALFALPDHIEKQLLQRVLCWFNALNHDFCLVARFPNFISLVGRPIDH